VKLACRFGPDGSGRGFSAPPVVARWPAKLPMFRAASRRLDFPELAGVATMIQRLAMKNLARFTVDPAQMGGVPCVGHLRIPVATVLRLLAGGLAEREILSEYPDLQAEDIRECLRFAAASAMEPEMPLSYSA
jgi:uncharacterized protein (DUF433 family)